MHDETTPPVPYGFCWCGCGQKTNLSTRKDSRVGLTRGEPRRFVNGHQMRGTGPMWAENEAGCWIWQRSLDRAGYGVFGRPSRYDPGRRVYLAHRWVYEEMIGPIPEGLELDHLCRVPACVNPDHLEPVTRAENVQRGAVAKITAEIAQAIRDAEGSQSEIGRRYGLSQAQVSSIRLGQSWRQLEDEAA